MIRLYRKISEDVISGYIEEVKKHIQQTLDEGAQASEILKKGLLPGMDIVGQRFKAAHMFIPEVILSARTMHAAMKILRPLVSESDTAEVGTVIIGTVEGDLHDIGKNLVGMMLEGVGFEVVDLGIDVKPQAFMESVKKHKARILGMSALLTTTMPNMEETINALKDAGIRDHVRVMAGGAPVTQEYVDKIGADAYGDNAWTAVERAKALVSCS